jgi:predicted metal-binding protein
MDVVKLCLYLGATKAEEIPVSKLVLSPELRELCIQNACGKYGQNYSCPPFVGDIHALIKKLKSFQKAVIWQNIYPLEDSFDFDGMMEAQVSHNSMTKKIADEIYREYGKIKALVLGAGSCDLCETCSAEVNEPCLRPNEVLPSLEAYGINVSKIADVSDMKYINGKNTVTYFSGAFFV